MKNDHKNNIIRLPAIEDIMVNKYIPYIDNKDRYLNFIGSRGSGKSVAVAQILIIRLLSHNFFRGVGIRKFDKDIKESIFRTMLDVLEDWGITHLFDIKMSPLKISCLASGNYMIFRGLNDPSSLKSLREVTCAFFEEETCDTLEDFTTIDLSIRTRKADWIQIIHALNPTLEGADQHWFYKHFGYADGLGMEFTKKITGLIDNREVEYSITSCHSTYKDNPFLPDVYKLKLENEKDEYSYAVNTLGIWSHKQIDGRFFKSFDITKNADMFEYTSELPLYLGIDFNSLPYCALVLYQLRGKKLYQVDEICVNDKKESSLMVALKAFVNKYKHHYLTVYIVGDATGRKDDAAHEKGFNNYSIVQEQLKSFRLEMMVPSKNPSVVARGEFVNKVFAEGYKGVEFWINKKCKQTINDFLYLRADYDGTIKKEIIKDKETGKSYEKFGHCSDSSTYILLQVFASQFAEWKSGGASFKPLMGGYSNPQAW